MRRMTVTIFFASLALVPTRSVQAQETHAVTRAEMDVMVAERAATADTDRDAIRALLRHPEVREVAERVGIDVRRAESAVDVLDADQVERLAPTARQLDDVLTGGASTIVISTTTLIIALLVLIIILVA